MGFRVDSGFGGMVERVREGYGMTQVNLADMAGISWTAVVDIESGDCLPTAEQAEAICEVLGIESCDCCDAR